MTRVVLSLARYGAHRIVASPFYGVLTAVAAVLLSIEHVFPLFVGEAESIALLKDLGISTILTWALVIGVFHAAVMLTDDLDHKVAQVVLTKPISRGAYLTGRALGIGAALLPGWVLLSTLLFWSVDRRSYYTLLENTPGLDLPLAWGLQLALVQAFLVTALAVLLSLRCPLFLNLAICFVVFLGARMSEHLLPQAYADAPAVREAIESGEVGAIRAASPEAALLEGGRRLLPDLSVLDVQERITSRRSVPADYANWASLYGIGYAAILLAAACWLFGRTELG